MKLTDIQIRNFKASDTPKKYSDGAGLFLLIKPSGSRLWQMKYRFGGKEKVYSIGPYGVKGSGGVSLQEAREKCSKAHKLLREGIDPSVHKQEAKRELEEASRNTFELVARDWHSKNKHRWSDDHGAKLLRRMEKHIFPYLGRSAVKHIKPPNVLTMLKIIEGRNTTEILHRVKQTTEQVFNYAISHGLCENNPVTPLQVALKPHKEKNYPRISASELPNFLARLEEIQANPVFKLATRILLHTFVRTKELRYCTWATVDLENKLWRIPAEIMKMRQEHLVPLTPQVVGIFEDLKQYSSGRPTDYLCPSQHRQKHPMMCENNINNLIHRMGYKGQMVGHGFRGLASTTLHEQGFSTDVIERQLSHADSNRLRGRYNKAEYMEERTKILHHWSSYIEAIEKKLPLTTQGEAA